MKTLSIPSLAVFESECAKHGYIVLKTWQKYEVNSRIVSRPVALATSTEDGFRDVLGTWFDDTKVGTLKIPNRSPITDPGAAK